MTDFFDGVRMGSFDTEYDDDTIEMVLTESAMHLLSQAAAQAESAGAVVGPVGKEPEAQAAPKAQPVVEAPAAAKVRAVAEADATAKVQPVAEVRATPKAQPAKALATPDAQPGVEAQAATTTAPPAVTAKQHVIAKDPVPPAYRP